MLLIQINKSLQKDSLMSSVLRTGTFNITLPFYYHSQQPASCTTPSDNDDDKVGKGL